MQVVELTEEQKSWLRTADPVTRELSPGAPALVVLGCLAMGLVKQSSRPRGWKLTDTGGRVQSRLRWLV
ncbi:hypothetical protein [Azospirillum sp. SYSU D00513]|uniref:hypothetical protein n=1 Tax=Azospirillum sp. SYSU D00513 TaxID=2812561 RepID=UPI001A9726ED|nr:hypothetical protein [Azospirillum sp. SYSU D00513]